MTQLGIGRVRGKGKKILDNKNYLEAFTLNGVLFTSSLVVDAEENPAAESLKIRHEEFVMKGIVKKNHR